MDHLDCFSSDDELNEHLDGETGGSRKTVIERHLGVCLDCSMRFEVAKRLKTILSDSRAGIESPAWLKTRILSTIAAEPEISGGGFWDYMTGVFKFKPLLPVSLVSALVIVFFAALFYETPQTATMPIVTAMVKEHYEYMGGPGENGILSSNLDEITGWMAVNAGINISVSSDQELPAPNSACVLRDRGETIGYVSFDYQNQKVSLFMIKEKREELFGPRKMDLRDISVYCGKCTGMNYVLWQADKMVCVLVGDLPQESLVDLADKMI